MVGGRSFAVTFHITFMRTNFDSNEKDPSLAELEKYVAESEDIPDSLHYFLDGIHDMEYTGGTSFRFMCNWNASARDLVTEITTQCMEDGAWEASPGNGSFVYPTQDGNEELGVLSYANVCAE